MLTIQIRSAIQIVVLCISTAAGAQTAGENSQIGAGTVLGAATLDLRFVGQSGELIGAGLELAFTGQTIVRSATASTLRFVGQAERPVTTTATLRFVGQDPVMRTEAVQLFSAIPRENTDEYRANPVARFRVLGNAEEPVPFRMQPDFSGSVTIPNGAEVTLAGTPDGSEGIWVDNFLVFEIAGTPSFVVGWTDPVTFGGRVLPHLGRNWRVLSPSGLDLTPFFVPGTTVSFRAMALDNGGSGFTSDIYLIYTYPIFGPQRD